MTTEELQQIVDFVHEAEEMLVEHGGDFATCNIELTKLHDNIKRFMDASAQSRVEDYRVLLAALLLSPNTSMTTKFRCHSLGCFIWFVLTHRLLNKLSRSEHNKPNNQRLINPPIKPRFEHSRIRSWYLFRISGLVFRVCLYAIRCPLHDSRTMSHEPRVTSDESRVTRYEYALSLSKGCWKFNPS